MKRKNIGIELLRLISMYMICLLHVCKQGGVLNRINMNTAIDKFVVAWIIEICAYCAVNLYAMISGYVGIKTKFKISRPIYLWIEIVFYTVIITAIIACFTNKITDYGTAWKNAIFPIMTGQYWYMTAYLGMIIFSPLLNIAINKIDLKPLTFILIGVFIFMCLMPSIFNVSVFGLERGYSMVWLSIMYVFGGYFARIEDKITMRKLFFNLSLIGVFVASVAITFVFKYNNYTRLIDYTSPTIVLTGISLFLIYSRLDIKSDGIFGKIIAFISPSALAVYLIHVQPLVWKNYVLNFAKTYVKSPAFVMGLRILWAALVIFAICIAIDMARRFIFWLIHIKPLMKQIDKAFDNLMNKIGEKKPIAENHNE